MRESTLEEMKKAKYERTENGGGGGPGTVESFGAACRKSNHQGEDKPNH
jgi:hypothetical protein